MSVGIGQLIAETLSLYVSVDVTPDFIQIRSLSAELYPNAWTPPERARKWIQYSAEGKLRTE